MDAERAFGKYELLERIALGGMAEIFLARSSSLGGVTRQCVIKRILPEYSTDRRFVSMFIDEARITIGLDHPNIVRFFDFGEVDGTYYMAMEFVNGLDLVDLLRQKKRDQSVTPLKPALFLAKSVCDGLHHAHTQTDFQGNHQNIVHRDVSPHNIFLSWSGDVKVGDFGIASARNKLSRTQTGTVKGKFAYMSPEHASRGVVDKRADIWAVGVVMHEMLCGRRLFASDNPIATIARVCEHPISRPSSRNKSIPAAVDDIVMRALERDLDARYQNADQMSQDIAALLGDFDAEDFKKYLESESFDSETRGEMQNPARETRRILPPALENDPILDALQNKLRERPDLWRIVEIGKRHVELKNRNEALSAFRAAAALFSYRGLLVQAVCAHAAAATLIDESALKRDLRAIWKIHQGNPFELTSFIEGANANEYLELVKELDEGFDSPHKSDDPENTLFRLPSPLLGRLSCEDFVRLSAAAKVREFDIGDTVIQEGDRSLQLFAVGRGRLVVHTQPDDKDASMYKHNEKSWAEAMRKLGNDRRIYLSALTEGDYFGEFSFLTSRPRSASVETISKSTVLEIDRKVAQQVLMDDANFKDPLLEFYKERVGELMLAKNPVFAVLSPGMRRQLLSNASLLRYRDQNLIVEEGQKGGDIYFVKHGEVEVFHEEKGLPVFINKLREGDFFGEAAALHRTPRSASVRAMGDVEVFCISPKDLDSVLSSEADAQRLFEAAIDARSIERDERIVESRRIFEGI